MKDVKIKEDQTFSKKNKDKEGKGNKNKGESSKQQKEETEELEIPCGETIPDTQNSKVSLEVEIGENDVSLNQIPSKTTH